MARTKIQIEVGELQDAITQLESTKLFSSPHKLYEAIAQSNWARALGATAVMIYLKVKEVNVDPDNPVITMRVKPARKVGPRDPNATSASRPATTRRAKVTGVTCAGFDVLMDVFQGRGIEVDSVEWLVASSQKSDAENRAIRLAWADLRDRLGLPKPAKKTDMGEDLVKIPTLPTADSSIAVTEEMPDGSPVSSQTVIDVEPVGEPEVTLDVISIETAVSSVPPSSPKPISSAPTQAVPSPMQVRHVQPRPMPVRSSVPPRPMPVNTGK